MAPMHQTTTMKVQPRLPPLWLAGSALAAAIVFLFGVARWIDHFTSQPNAEDYRLHAVAAQIGLTYGWSHIYDIALQKLASAGIGPIDSMHLFVSPPPAAWMVVPLAWLPIPVGYLVWSALIPAQGLDRAKAIAEWLVWIPFGSAAIVALWWLAGLVAWRMSRP